MNKSIATLAYAVVAVLTCSDANAALVIGGWDSTRGGSNAVFDGSQMTVFRSTIAGDHPGVVFSGTNTLTSAYLSTVDLVLLSSATGGSGGTTAITPLTASEHTALTEFVLAGHTAMIFVDNDTYAGIPASSNANNSLLAPFGLHVSGTLGGFQSATVANPFGNPLTDGPYGTVNTLGGFYVGEFDNLNGAQNLANWPNGPGLAYLAPGAFAPGSGVVVFVSDTIMANGMFNASDNATLIRNAIADVPEPASVALLLLGIAGYVVIRASRSRTDLPRRSIS